MIKCGSVCALKDVSDDLYVITCTMTHCVFKVVGISEVNIVL